MNEPDPIPADGPDPIADIAPTNGKTGPSPALKARAWHMSVREGKSTRVIGDELGVSHATAHRWIKSAEEAEGWIDALDRAEGRVGQAMRLQEYMGWIRTAYGQGRDPMELIPIALKVEERMAKLGGYDAPTRIQNESSTTPPPVDPELVREVAKARATAERELRALDGPPDERSST